MSVLKKVIKYLLVRGNISKLPSFEKSFFVPLGSIILIFFFKTPKFWKKFCWPSWTGFISIHTVKKDKKWRIQTDPYVRLYLDLDLKNPNFWKNLRILCWIWFVFLAKSKFINPNPEKIFGNGPNPNIFHNAWHVWIWICLNIWIFASRLVTSLHRFLWIKCVCYVTKHPWEPTRRFQKKKHLIIKKM